MWSLCVGRKNCYFFPKNNLSQLSPPSSPTEWCRCKSSWCRQTITFVLRSLGKLSGHYICPPRPWLSGWRSITSLLWHWQYWTNTNSVMSCDVMWSYVMSCGLMWCHVVSCDVRWCHVISCDVMWLVISIIILCSVHKCSIIEFTTAFLPKPCRDLCFASCIIIFECIFIQLLSSSHETSSRQLQILFKLCLMIVLCVCI